MVVVRATFLIRLINCWNACISHYDRYASFRSENEKLLADFSGPETTFNSSGTQLWGYLDKASKQISRTSICRMLCPKGTAAYRLL
jgi:hypothetical protein